MSHPAASTLEFERGPWSQPVAKPAEAPKECPFCQQQLENRQRTVDRFLTRAIHQTVFGIWLVLVGVVRFVRLVVAAAFCCVGVVGMVARRAGYWIAHPDDRRLLRFSESRSAIVHRCRDQAA